MYICGRNQLKEGVGMLETFLVVQTLGMAVYVIRDRIKYRAKVRTKSQP